MTLGGAVLHGWSKNQALIAQSSAEAEFYALTFCAAEVMYTTGLIQELGHPCQGVLKEDASACIGLASRLGPGRIKHLEIKHLALQQWLRKKRLVVDKVRTEDQKADVLTKAYPTLVANKLFPLIGLILSWAQPARADDGEDDDYIDEKSFTMGVMVLVAMIVFLAAMCWRWSRKSTREVGTQTFVTEALDEGVPVYVTAYGMRFHSTKNCPTLAASYPIQIHGRTWCQVCTPGLVTKDAKRKGE